MLNSQVCCVLAAEAVLEEVVAKVELASIFRVRLYILSVSHQ